MVLLLFAYLRWMMVTKEKILLEGFLICAYSQKTVVMTSSSGAIVWADLLQFLTHRPVVRIASGFVLKM